MIELRAELESAELSAHESPRLRCEIHNPDGEAVTLPSPYDRSGAFRVLLLGEDLSLLRLMNRRTRQRMMTSGRVDESQTLE